MLRLRFRLGALLLLAAPLAARAQRSASHASPHPRRVYVDRQGVLRWQDDHGEVALFGANYTLPSASDYRAAGYLHLDRKKLIDEDMAHFARMGWTALRISWWGDWENADSAGDLIANDHLDLADYLIAKARERGIYVLLTPITTYNAGWPDAMPNDTASGFSNRFSRAELGTNPKAIAVEARYIRQLLRHVNPYTGLAWADDPAIPFVELINEPVHHPDQMAEQTRYIDTLAAAVRSTGSKAILFYNVSQDFRIAPAILHSAAQGLTFGWYPSGLNSGHELRGDFLRRVDDYPPMRDPALERLPRIIYEFESPDLRTGYMYPAMVRTFRSVGAQLATMFAYDMLGTASRNLGWQTHYLNLVYTPKKAMSAVIAAEAMRRLPRWTTYGPYPRDTSFGDFRVSYHEDLGELVAPDAFLYDDDTKSMPPDPARLTRIAGYGSSPVVRYEGRGVYFLDRVRAGVWRLEVYPDAVPVRDPFERPNPTRIVTRAIRRTWPMTVHLPDLGASFTVQPITDGNSSVTRAEEGRFAVRPGVYVLSARGAVDRASLPDSIDRLGFAEFHAPATDSLGVRVVTSSLPEVADDRPVEISARVVDTVAPDSVLLWLRRAGSGFFFRPRAMRRAGAYTWRASIPADSLGDGDWEYMVTVVRQGRAATFPDDVAGRPSDWDFAGEHARSLRVVPPATPLPLFVPARDVARLAFSRIGDAGRTGIFRLVPSSATGEPALHLALPVFRGWSPPDYTASLVVKDRIAGRGSDASRATAVRVRLRALGAGQTVHVTLVEDDGTSWSAAVTADTAWTERTIPLADFHLARGVMLPEGFPGEWNYWLTTPADRGGAGDAVRPAHVERLQLSLRKADAPQPAPDGYGVELGGVTLLFR